ncbi:MAG: squalene--hopene cyclase [Deinococcales bacterium]
MSADDARRRPADGATPWPPSTPEAPAAADTRVPDADPVRAAIARSQAYLLDRQHPDGYWRGELEADASVTAGLIPVLYAVHGEVDPVRRDKAVAFVRAKQQPDGGWPAYHGGPDSLDVSIQAYFGLKLAGVPADDPAMRRARDFVVGEGGVQRANLVTRMWLAVFGQVDYATLPTVPPELMLLPENGPFSIYDFASWSRETLVALMLVSALKPRFEVPQGRGVEGHQEADGSWGGIMLPWVYALFALKALGYANDHPVMARAIAGLEDFIVEDEHTLRLEPAVSPVWDTAWAVLALRESGLPADHPALQRAARWLLDREIRSRGDWRVKNPQLEAGGWAFEFANAFYPDLDDTPVVARALTSVRLPPEQEPRRRAAVRRALDWTLGMQSKDGGFAAFDRDNDLQALAHVPFSDFVPPLDPTCADVTAHALELLATLGERGAAYRRALDYLARTQESDGAWYGRWGVNYLYGTGLALAALAATGEDPLPTAARRAGAWLMDHQNDDGGWGETCASYEAPGPTTRGRGPSTPSQTGWALLGLMGARGADDPAVRRGVAYLLTTQRQNGDWPEEAYTGTGFPGTFYLRYELYRSTFPLLALARASATG